MRRDAAGAGRRRAGVVRAEEWAVRAAEWVARSFPMGDRAVREGREVRGRRGEVSRRGKGGRAPSLAPGCSWVRRDDGGMTRDLPRA